MQRMLRQDENLAGVPMHLLSSLAELKLIGRQLYAHIKAQGAIRKDDAVQPAVEAHRKNAHEQLCFLNTIAELRRAQTSEPRDIVAFMEQPDTAEVVQEGSEPEENQGEN
jgi:hypothetical protein